MSATTASAMVTSELSVGSVRSPPRDETENCEGANREEEEEEEELRIPDGAALAFELRGTCGRARAGRLRTRHCTVETPVFMPVGTYGSIKGLTPDEVKATGHRLILGNAYHLNHSPGCDVLERHGGLHGYARWRGSLLTDSGGFQMVSLCSHSVVSEEGVRFEHPVDKVDLLLTPEESMKIQNSIGADIMMALDDVVSAVLPDRDRVEEATHRTTRWLDRCIAAHTRPSEQSLFGIIHGGLHADLRTRSLAALVSRDTPGYAIGGLSGGEAKSDFWRMVSLCTSEDGGPHLPREKPRYCMGVGYQLDIVVCVALGVDMFDCVYPTRTARFGTAITRHGTMRLRHHAYARDTLPIDANCDCYTCRHYSRAFLHNVAARDAMGTPLITIHNLTHMHNLCRRMRRAIREGKFSIFVREFLSDLFYSDNSSEAAEEREKSREKQNRCNNECGDDDGEHGGCCPKWALDAFQAAGLSVEEILPPS
eukprot:GHVU01154495.1.p1 GENE.GHVU01154495.1~~GHVU01154495.1.p1  ORF type:complete len:481 (+),score=74.56 GHVU01154495.1:446-1888(+)